MLEPVRCCCCCCRCVVAIALSRYVIVHPGILRFFLLFFRGWWVFLSSLSPFAVARSDQFNSRLLRRARLQCRFTARFISEVTDASSKFYVAGIVTLEVKRAQQGHTYLYVRT